MTQARCNEGIDVEKEAEDIVCYSIPCGTETGQWMSARSRVKKKIIDLIARARAETESAVTKREWERISPALGYAHHRSDCRFLRNVDWSNDPTKCDCGFAKAIKSAYQTGDQT